MGYFYDLLKPEGSGAMTPAREMGAAFLGGLASGIPCSMWELTMIQQQVRVCTGFEGISLQLYRICTTFFVGGGAYLQYA